MLRAGIFHSIPPKKIEIVVVVCSVRKEEARLEFIDDLDKGLKTKLNSTTH